MYNKFEEEKENEDFTYERNLDEDFDFTNFRLSNSRSKMPRANSNNTKVSILFG